MPESAEGLGHALSAGTAQEMQETFKHVAGNAIIARVFFELARDFKPATRHGALPCRQSRRSRCGISISSKRSRCSPVSMRSIRRFQQIRRDPQASLFAIDETGHIYLHQLTYLAIRQVWQQLVAAHPWPASDEAMRPEYAFGQAPTDMPIREK